MREKVIGTVVNHEKGFSNQIIVTLSTNSGEVKFRAIPPHLPKLQKGYLVEVEIDLVDDDMLGLSSSVKVLN